MAFKTSCPECDAVLRPVKPLTPGQKVKCPKCGVSFTFKGDDSAGEDSPKPAKPRRDVPTSGMPAREPGPAKKTDKGKPAGKTTGGSKKPEVKTVEVAKPSKKPSDDDDDDGGTYTFAGGQEKQEGPEVAYVPDVGIKDLRGPAAALVTPPSNKLIMAGGAGFLGWMGLLILLTFPVVFKIDDKDDKAAAEKMPEVLEVTSGLAYVAMEKDPPQEGTFKPVDKKDQDNSIYKMGSFDILSYMMSALWVIIVVMVCGFGMIYCGIVAMGGVKLQNMESRGWGMAAAIMLMIPITTGGLNLLTIIVMWFILEMTYIIILLILIEWGTNVALGIYTLVILNKEEVIDGFNYVPDS